MLKFCLGVLVAATLLTAGWIQGLRAQLGVPTPASRWVFDANQHKIAAANAVAGPRVLVVAGSNALFGIDSAQLETYWRRPAINLAVNAGLGLPYILDLSRRLARPGDVILLPMEYALYLDQGEPNGQIVDYVVARDLDYWRSLSRFEQLHFAAVMAPERWVQGLRHLPDGPVTSGTYGAHHLDARGDQTFSTAADQTPADLAAVSAAKASNYGQRASKENGGWRFIADYGRWARANHICLVAVPTVLLHHASYDAVPVEKQFYAGLPDRLRALGVAYAGLPRNFMYQPAWFFDTDHHLQDWARKRHTAALIAVLDPVAQNYCK